MHTAPIRRYSNGTVDIEFYREKALAMRAQVQAQTLRNLNRMVRPLIFGRHSPSYRGAVAAAQYRAGPTASQWHWSQPTSLRWPIEYWPQGNPQNDRRYP